MQKIKDSWSSFLQKVYDLRAVRALEELVQNEEWLAKYIDKDNGVPPWHSSKTIDYDVLQGNTQEEEDRSDWTMKEKQ